jgi:hypothetical protein
MGILITGFQVPGTAYVGAKNIHQRHIMNQKEKLELPYGTLDQSG